MSTARSYILSQPNCRPHLWTIFILILAVVWLSDNRPSREDFNDLAGERDLLVDHLVRAYGDYAKLLADNQEKTAEIAQLKAKLEQSTTQPPKAPQRSNLTVNLGVKKMADESENRRDVKQMIRNIWPDESEDQAIKVFSCESGLNPAAINRNARTKDHSVGLAQINIYGSLARSRPSEEWLLDPTNNLNYALSLYQASGWVAWSCRP